MRPVLSVVAAWLVAATAVNAQSRKGAMLLRVADANDSTLSGASILLPTLDVTFAVPTTGSLVIRDVAPGTYIVQARRLGYVSQSKLLRVDKDTAQLRFALLPTANQLDTVRVAEINGTWQADFLRRQTAGLGQFFTQADILAAHADRVSSLLRNARGLLVSLRRDGGPDQLTLARSAGDCNSVAIYLDGVLMNGQAVIQTPLLANQPGGTAPPTASTVGNNPPPAPTPQNPPAQAPTSAKPTARAVYQAGQNGTMPITDQSRPEVMGVFDVNSIPLSALGGIEVYTNSATIPPQYKRNASTCGVILLWSK
jgi:hypothetical protein